MYDHYNPTRWGTLSTEEKERIEKKTSAILKCSMQNPNKLIPYEYLNKVGCEHLYRFLVELWNDNHPGKVEILERGIMYKC